MNLWEAALSGILQGISEFLPISSSGHLVLLHHFFGYKEPQILFDIILHIGTLFAILVYFRNDIVSIFTKRRYFLYLIMIGLIPTGVIGFLFEAFFRQAFSSIKLVGFMLILTSAVLFSADFVTSYMKKRGAHRLKFGVAQALIIGIAQGISALPGLSRSGVTISTALMCRVTKEHAIRYSFLMAIPAVLGALFLELRNTDALSVIFTPQMIVGFFSAFIVGLVAIYYVIMAVTREKLWFFGVYCLLVGGVVLVKAYF
ncbi:MAG: undecaprenyl-diphosphate phosphatase [Candidatus Omnitrophota bacterium]